MMSDPIKTYRCPLCLEDNLDIYMDIDYQEMYPDVEILHLECDCGLSYATKEATKLEDLIKIAEELEGMIK